MSDLTQIKTVTGVASALNDTAARQSITELSGAIDYVSGAVTGGGGATYTSPSGTLLIDGDKIESLPYSLYETSSLDANVLGVYTGNQPFTSTFTSALTTAFVTFIEQGSNHYQLNATNVYKTPDGTSINVVTSTHFNEQEGGYIMNGEISAIDDFSVYNHYVKKPHISESVSGTLLIQDKNIESTNSALVYVPPQSGVSSTFVDNFLFEPNSHDVNKVVLYNVSSNNNFNVKYDNDSHNYEAGVYDILPVDSVYGRVKYIASFSDKLITVYSGVPGHYEKTQLVKQSDFDNLYNAFTAYTASHP